MMMIKIHHISKVNNNKVTEDLFFVYVRRRLTTMKTILVAAALAAETMTSCTSFALQRPRVTRQLLRFASSSTTSAEEWKRKRPLRIRARYIPPGDDTTGRDGIVVHFQRHGQVSSLGG